MTDKRFAIYTRNELEGGRLRGVAGGAEMLVARESETERFIGWGLEARQGGEVQQSAAGSGAETKSQTVFGGAELLKALFVKG